MKRLGSAKILLLGVTVFLVLSIVLSVASLYPVATGSNQKSIIIHDSFRLSQNEVFRQGLGAFRGGENLSLTVDSPTVFTKNFAVVTSNTTIYSNLTNQNITHSFIVGPSYYEAVFYSNELNASWINFQVTVEKPQVVYPLGWLNTPAKIMFLISATSALIIILKWAYPRFTEKLGPIPRVTTFNENLPQSLVGSSFDIVGYLASDFGSKF